MFTDTPKLQPISTSRNNDKKVPSNNQSSNNSNGCKNAASNATASANKQDSFSNRYNYGSYRGNNYQNQNYPKNYKTREFNEYYTNSFIQSNNYNSYNRWPDWSNTSSTTYNRRKLNHNNNNNKYRINYKYSENTYKEYESSFAEDSYQYNSFNNSVGKINETDHVKNTYKKQTNAYKHKSPSNNVKIKKQSEETKSKRNVITKNKPQNRNYKKASHTKGTNHHSKAIDTKSTEKEPKNPIIYNQNIALQDSPILNAITTVATEVNFENNESNIILDATDTEPIKSIRALESKSLNLEENILETSNVSAIALNDSFQIEQHAESILNSAIENISNITNSSDPAACAIPIELIQPEKEINGESARPHTVLENIAPTLFQNKRTSSLQPLNTSATSESENFDFHTPKISLIPISRLIASEFWESYCSDSVLVDNSLKQPNTPQKTVYKPNLIKRKRNVSTCSNSSTSSQTNSTADRIVDKLVTMSKINIKNVINSSETKYDEALKTQARKRLRDEIRRQLKSMNIEPPKDPISTDFIPYEIVDSIDIPDVVFDEIRKALGLELFSFSKDDNMKSIEEVEASASAEDNASAILPPVVEKTNTTLGTNSASDYTATVETAIELSELQQNQMCTTLPLQQTILPIAKCKIKTNNNSTDKHSEEKIKTEENRKKSKKLTKRKESHKSKRHRSPKEVKEDVVVLISSSSSSESSSTSSSSSSSSSPSSSSTSSSDSESDTSAKSSTSAVKRKRLKLKVDAENVVDSFEKLILSSLSENLRDRYRAKYSTSINTKLHFISCICTSDYNSGKFSKLQIAKVQKNLKSSDCSVALEFLMKEIVNVFNKQKQVAKMEDSNKTSRRLESSPKRESTKDASKEASNENAAKEKSSNGKTHSKSATILSDTVKIKSVNAAEKINLATATNGEKHIQQCLSKVLSLYRQEMKAAMQANETKNQPSSTQKSLATAGNESTILQQEQQTSMKSTSSNNLDKNAGHAKENEDEAHLQNPNCINQQQENLHQTAEQQSETINRDYEKNHQATTGSLTKVQQCDDNAAENISTQIIPIHSFCSSGYIPLNGNLSSTILGISSGSFNQQPPFPIVDLEELKQQSPIGDVVVNNLREIDVKLMELHKRKMYLEEMILKLQKDKMEADLLTIKLQNEKFILLNTAMTANVTSTAIKNHNSNSEKIKNCSFSSAKNIKIETTSSFTDKRNVAVEKMEEESRKGKDSKPRNYGKSTAQKRIKRKQPPTAPSSETLKKRCKSSKQTAKQKSCSKRTSTQSKTNKSSDLTSETSSTYEASNALTSARVENVAELPADCSSLLPTTSAESITTPEPPASSQPPPSTTIFNNNPKVDDKSKSVYKNMPTGSFDGIRNPITQIRVFEKFIVASSEDGKLYKFDVSTLKLLKQFAKHSEAITQMYLCPERKSIYTTSLDGYLKKSSLENFELDLQSVYLQEPLQSIDIQWGVAYVGSRWGNIYTYNVHGNSLTEKPLCSTDSSIISIKATKESIRKILIVSSKGNLLHLRDAISGLLLRTFDMPESINIYSILLNDGIIYCGTQKKEIRKYDFVSGQYLGLMTCGNGAVSMQMYSNKYIFVGCYDGFIYILDKSTGKQVGRLAGSGKMILTLEVIEDKIITSAKDNSMKVTDIPSYCLKNNT